MTLAELNELREAWRDAVLLEPRYLGDVTVPRRCWFSEQPVDFGECIGRILGSHWIKRRRVESTLAIQLDIPLKHVRRAGRRDPGVSAEILEVVDLILLAAWDPRVGVPACVRHDDKMDGHQVDAADEFIVWRHQVPAHVIDFANDWGLEQALEDRNPSMTGGI